MLLRRIGKEEKEVSIFGSPVRVYFEIPIFRTANLIYIRLVAGISRVQIRGAEKRRKKRRRRRRRRWF